MNTPDSINIKTTRLSKSKYDRPTKTLTDSLQTNAKMKEKLENYQRVDDIDDVSLSTHVRYVTLKDGVQRFCLGGLLVKKHSKYVVLSNGNFSWSVQRYHWTKGQNSGTQHGGRYEPEEEEPCFETIFFKVKSKQDKQNDIIQKQAEQIEQLKNMICNR